MTRTFTKVTPDHLATAAFMFAIVVAPLGVAGQNIGLGVALATYLALNALESWRPLRRCFSDLWARQYALLLGLIVIPITCATIARGNYKEASRFFGGYLFVCSVPVFAKTLSNYRLNRKVLSILADVILVVMGLVCLTQFLWAWKIENHQIVSTIRRSQGFYSHPLTLAYAALPLMPWTTTRFFRDTGNLRSLIAWLSLVMVIATSQSVTVIFVTAVSTMLLAIRILSVRKLVASVVVAASASVAVLTTENPISEKIHMVLTGTRSDHETDYPDDRMAFWHANFEMFMDAPLTGHGTGLGREDRRPYFEKIGLGHLKRMYESHNMYLQYAVEGGVIPALGLAAFLFWWFISTPRLISRDAWTRLTFKMTPVMFALAGLTQNSIQDSEVRYVLMLVLAGFISRI